MRKVTLIIKLIIKIWLLSLFMNILLGGAYFNHSVIALPTTSLGNFEEYSDYTTAVGGSATIPVQEIDTVELTFFSGDITILPYDGEDFKIDYRGGAVDCVYQVDGHTLHICPKLEHFHVNVGFSLGSQQQDGDITLYVPQSVTHLNVDVESVSSEVEITIPGNELSVQAVSGDVSALSSFRSMEMETVSGDIIVTAIPDYSLTHLACDTVSGDLTLSGGFNYRLDMDSLSGNVRGNSSSDAGNLVDIYFQSVSGDMISK